MRNREVCFQGMFRGRFGIFALRIGVRNGLKGRRNLWRATNKKELR